MKGESLSKRLYNLVQRTRTNIIINLLTGIGLSFLILCLVFQREGSLVQGILLLLFSLFIGLSGLVMIIRREVDYSIISFDGFPAVLIGSIILLASVMFSILFLNGLLSSLAK